MQKESIQSSLQMLRGIAATLVVWCHAEALLARISPSQPTFSQEASYLGAFGVDIFFVISGAVMMIASQALFGKVGAHTTFLKRRIARIYPPYWLYASVMVGIVIVAGEAVQPGYVLESMLLLPVLNDAGKLRPILGVGWTLSYELYFYAVFAGLLVLPRQRVPIAIGGLLGAVLLLATLVLDPQSAWGVFLSSPIVFEFFAGTLLGMWVARLSFLPGWVGFILILAGIAGWLSSPEPSMAERWIVWGGPAASIVAGALVLEKGGGSNRLGRALVALGDCSYSLYLSHPVLFLVLSALVRRLKWGGALPGELGVVLAMAVSICFSYPAYLLLELPMTRAMRRLLFRVDGERRLSPSEAA